MSDELVDELKWLARQRNQSDLRTERGQALARALGVDPESPAELCAAVDAAVEAMDSDAHQEAARWLVGSGPLRWEAVKSRQHEAAKVFDVKTDAFRRKRTKGRPSREDEVLTELARAIQAAPAGLGSGRIDNGTRATTVAVADSEIVPVGTGPGTGPGTGTGSGSPGDPLVDTPDGGSARRRWRWLLPIGLAVVAAVAGLGWRLGGRPDDRGSAVPSLGEGCPHEVSGGDLVTDPVITGAVRNHFDVSGGEAQYGCALAPLVALPDSPLSYQEFGSPGKTPREVIVAYDDGRVLTVPFAAWGSYRQIGGKAGDQAYAIAGDPVGLRVTGAAAYFDLGTDVQLVAEVAEAPYFFVIPIVVEAWEANGGVVGELGLPTSNPYVRDGNWRQEFQTGYLEASPNLAEIRWKPVESPRSELPPDEEVAGRIVAQLDATSWYINGDLQRLWIPDHLVWECLGGDGNALTHNTPGYAVAQLPYGGIATCADAGT